jgi:hypothetical protein
MTPTKAKAPMGRGHRGAGSKGKYGPTKSPNDSRATPMFKMDNDKFKDLEKELM